MTGSYRRVLLLAGYICIAIVTSAQVQKQQPISAGKKISADLFGLFFEDINYAADGGLYAELVQNRSFEYSPTDRREWNPFSYWEYITPGFSYGSVQVETTSPVHPNNPHYIVLNIEHAGDAGVGIRNPGFDGMVVKAGDVYTLSLFARSLTDIPVSLAVSLQTPKGKILAEQKFSTPSKEWKKYTASLVPSIYSDSASLVILATTKGKLAIDVVSLFPEKTFMNRQNGLRPDMAQALADMKPKFIRFPGGCLVHGDGLGNMYRWKNSIGPVEQRIEQKNIWGYHQTAGLGYFEYFQFCEDIGAKPLPVLPAAVSCQNSGGTWRIGGTGQKAIPMEEMSDYIQEVLDLIEWANGPVTSTWGAIRAAAGHPAPFNLEYIGIGNEDKITPEFEQRFKMIYDAVREKYPAVTVIGTVGPFPEGDDFSRGWVYARHLAVPVVDEHYYKNPEWFMSNLDRYDTYNRNQPQVYLGEYASWDNKLKNAIAEAAYMTSLERNGDVVRMASYAPLFAKKNHTQWKPDMIFFDNSTLYFTPNYYVQKMFSINQGNVYFDGVVSKNQNDTTLATSCVQDSKTGDVILKLVNTNRESKVMKISLANFKGISPTAGLTILSGDADAENSFEHPQNIVPVQTSIKVSRNFEHTAPPMSLSIIRIKTKR
ncbi:MAG TPA: alpha-L-arabinofuranosidase C-terminal domain-containing protein [Ohtaekwangia sp.]|uniref:alpha-L-arabinofuranosidase C-terminal domain-containing protein n=1 Tax=Ohtaekwangia sp. TaxID=2066019 RepID=UPI002F93C2E9